MTSSSKSTRRTFIHTTIQSTGAALSVPLTAAAAATPAGGASEGGSPNARLAWLEDILAIRALNLEFAKSRNLVPADFGDEDAIEIASDRGSARALLHCIVDVEEPIGPDCPLVQMAREQGGGVVRRIERGVFENVCVRRDGVWSIQSSTFEVQ